MLSKRHKMNGHCVVESVRFEMKIRPQKRTNLEWYCPNHGEQIVPSPCPPCHLMRLVKNLGALVAPRVQQLRRRGILNKAHTASRVIDFTSRCFSNCSDRYPTFSETYCEYTLKYLYGFVI